VKPLARILNWRLLLVQTHRWLGIAGCVLFAAWFSSGVVMMYARMPELALAEQLARAPALDLSTATIGPESAAEAAGATAASVEVAMVQGRPAYRFGGTRARGGHERVVFADTGESFSGATLEQAREAARQFEPQYSGALTHTYLTEPDQWTLQARAQMPMFRFALDDRDATRLYVSEASGEVVLRTTRRERFWGYLGPVIHWVYFTPLRRNGPLWTQFIIWASLAGCLMCATGLMWGLLRFSPFARYRFKRRPVRSPYVGWMKWHHWSGLVFGVVTLTWTYSGLLSMGPFDWFQPVGRAAGGQRGAPSDSRPNPISLGQLQAGLAAISASFTPKAMTLTTVQGQRYWAADRPPTPADADRWRSPSLLPRTHRPRLERRYVAVAHAEGGSFATFSRETMRDVARAAMLGVPLMDEEWIDAYDGYYYDPRGADPLPVLRARYADPQETWLYLDPGTGGIVRRSERITRLQRWLYQGLHSLDFPFLYFRRPLWDIVVIILSVGGFVLSVTTVVPACRRLIAHARRVATWLKRGLAAGT
jgi:hypothetical protein